MTDPDSGTPDRVDILLGVDTVRQILLQSRRHGPPQTPTALDTFFGWVLSGAVRCDQPQK